MEDTLRDYKKAIKNKQSSWCVLILVLMEDTLRDVYELVASRIIEMGLNPCFNGRYS